MKNALFITVRLDSTRLADKAVKPILGRPVIEMIILRAKLAKEIDRVVVCTTEREIDDEIVEIAERNGVDFYRGSLTDKLVRWQGAAHKFDADYFITFDGDDLFCDPYLIDKGACQLKERNLDFIESPAGLVSGAFTYGIRTSALNKVCEIKDTDDTEMMWTYFKDTGLFRLGSLEVEEDIYFSDDIRLTLDYPEDFKFFEAVFSHFNCVKNDVPLSEIMQYLRANPEIVNINTWRQADFLTNQRNRTKLSIKQQS